jgi:CBS domain-containing protein
MSEAIASLPVSSLIGDELITVTPDTTIDAVARLLTDAGISLVAVGEPTAVEGVISERDVVRLVAEGADPTTVTAGELASRELVWCRDSSSVPEVANEMFSRYVRHVLVSSDSGLVGIVSARDLLGVYASEDMGFET